MSARKSSYVFEYRFTILGAEKVGKSSILRQFVEYKFMEDHTPTTENHLTRVVEHKDNLCVCLLVDTAGADDFPAMRKLSITKGNAFIVVYSINDKKSFARAKKFVETIKCLKKGSPDIKIVVVGNKNDLVDERRVPYQDGFDYSASLQADDIMSSFVEANAKDYDSVEVIFHKLLKMFSPLQPQIEVPVLLERKSSQGKIKIKGRRTSKGLIERKISTAITKTFLKNESLSDSELESNKRALSLPKASTSVLFKKTGKPGNLELLNSQSNDNLKNCSPSPSHFRRRTSSAASDISSPTLLSHSMPFKQYNIIRKPSLHSIDSVSSNDSGVSDGRYSPVSPHSPTAHSPGFNTSGSSPTIYDKLQTSQSSLVSTISQQSFQRSSYRRASLSNRIKGLFRRPKSPTSP